VRDQVAPGFAVVLNWAQGAWDQAKQTVAEKLRRSAEDSGEKAT
jgi:hypothetical protein